MVHNLISKFSVGSLINSQQLNKKNTIELTHCKWRRTQKCLPRIVEGERI